MEDKLTTSEISTEIYNSICDAAMDYMLSFQSNDAAAQQNYTLKRDHIHRVVGYTEVLTRSIECEETCALKAQLVALLHDIGRFQQFEKYQTFNDSISEDHAELAIKIIEENNWLNQFSPEIQQNIKKAILNHNKLAIPKNESEEVLLLSQIIRDADKLDILDMAIKEYSPQNKNRNNTFTFDLEASSTISKLVIKSILAEKLPNKADLKTITDFKLMQLAYVFDLNFRESFSIVNKKGYLKQLFDTLPKTDQIFDFYRRAKIYVENQLI